MVTGLLEPIYRQIDPMHVGEAGRLMRVARDVANKEVDPAEFVVQADRPVLDFLDADYTFVNERLAKHYGMSDVKGAEFRKVKLPDGRRGGVVTMASTMTVTSNPTRTSPV